MNSQRRYELIGSLVFVGLVAVACGGSVPSASTSNEAEQQTSERGDSVKGDGSGPAEGEATETKVEEGGSYPVPEVGRRTEEKRALEASVSFVLSRDDGIAAGMADKSWSFSEGRRTAVEKVNKSAVTQFSVLYGKREGKGLEDWTPLPTEGKPYTIKVAGGGLEVVGQDGSKISPEERGVIDREYGHMGKPHPLAVLLERAKGGDQQNLSKEAMLALVGFMPEMQLDIVQARRTGTEQQGGREATKLDVELQGVIINQETRLALTLKGPALIDSKTGWVAALDLAGEMQVSGYYHLKNKRLKASGKGKIKLGRSTKIF